jgi:hypothetical protein
VSYTLAVATTEKANSDEGATVNEIVSNSTNDVQGSEENRSHKQQQQQQQQQTTLFSSRVCNKPFWIWDIEEHKTADIITNGDYCFNHIIGLPTKNAQDKPFFDYEKLLFDTLQQCKHIWIKKATGLGITEFMLRYMTWLCLRNNNLQGTQMCIVTGPRIDLAITLIDRMKRLFTDNGLVTFDSKETIIN